MTLPHAGRFAPRNLALRYLAGALRRYPLSLTLVLSTVITSILGAGVASLMPAGSAGFVAPTLGPILILMLFWLSLQRQLGGNVLGELGLVYVVLLAAYTVLPALAFLGAGIYEGGPLGALLPESGDLQRHLWRHAIFAFGIAAGYLLFRGKHAPTFEQAPPSKRDTRSLWFAGLLLAVVLPSLSLFSAPVESYYDHYARYGHLPWVARKIASAFIRMSLGLYCVLLVFLFRDFKRYRLWIPVALGIICTYEVLYSHGARIQALIVLLQAACLYHFLVRRISLKMALLAAGGLVVLFSAIELVRTLNFDIGSARAALEDDGLQPAGELTSVFFPGFHLYAERAAGTLPPREWPMLFNDFIALVTFGDFSRWNPMTWYANYYFPEAAVTPFTLGPIADSAVWGGEPDLLVRGLLNGAFFALIMRWFVRYSGRWWGLTIYAYCFATCILTLKYGIFLQLALVEKNLLGVLLLIHAVRVLKLPRLRHAHIAT